MFKRIKNFFRKKPREDNISRYSITLQSSKNGVNSKKELNPEIKDIISKARENNKIQHDDINKLMAYYFNSNGIKPGTYKINKDIANSVVFDIVDVNLIFDKNGDVFDIVFVLRDTVSNLGANIIISGTEFYDFFVNFNKPYLVKEKKGKNHVD